MVLRGTWTVVLIFWLAGPLAGGGCLRACPDLPASTAADSCHASPPDTEFSGTHDCGAHVSASQDVVFSKGRSDVAPARDADVMAPTGVAAVRVGQSHARFDSSPPIRFLTPLRT